MDQTNILPGSFLLSLWGLFERRKGSILRTAFVAFCAKTLHLICTEDVLFLYLVSIIIQNLHHRGTLDKNNCPYIPDISRREFFHIHNKQYLKKIIIFFSNLSKIKRYDAKITES